MSFKPGSVVRLKSGGPQMTVEHMNDGVVYCVWFNQDASVYTSVRDSFQPESLELINY